MPCIKQDGGNTARVTAMTPPSKKQQTVYCWTCKHLQKVHQGPPRNGVLFSCKTYRCTISGREFDEYWQITSGRACDHHVQVGNWEAPLEVLAARNAWKAMEDFGKLTRSQRLHKKGYQLNP